MNARQISNFEFRGLDGFIRTGPNLGPEIAGFLSLAIPHRRAFSQVLQWQHMSARGSQRCLAGAINTWHINAWMGCMSDAHARVKQMPAEESVASGTIPQVVAGPGLHARPGRRL